MSRSSWVQLPDGTSFELSQVNLLGEITEQYDNEVDCSKLYFRICLNFGGVYECKLYDCGQTIESAKQTRNLLEKFREKIAVARWGSDRITIDDPES